MTRSAILITDRLLPNCFRVECEVEDGAIEIATFSGPDAKDRAINYAGNPDIFDNWSDPETLAGY